VCRNINFKKYWRQQRAVHMDSCFQCKFSHWKCRCCQYHKSFSKKKLIQEFQSCLPKNLNFAKKYVEWINFLFSVFLGDERWNCKFFLLASSRKIHRGASLVDKHDDNNNSNKLLQFLEQIQRTRLTQDHVTCRAMPSNNNHIKLTSAFALLMWGNNGTQSQATVLRVVRPQQVRFVAGDLHLRHCNFNNKIPRLFLIFNVSFTACHSSRTCKSLPTALIPVDSWKESSSRIFKVFDQIIRRSLAHRHGKPMINQARCLFPIDTAHFFFSNINFWRKLFWGSLQFHERFVWHIYWES